MIKNKHSIQKVFLEIDTPSMVMVNSIKNNLTVFIQNELVPILEKQFNFLENIENQTIQIEKIEISINSNTSKTDIFLSNSEPKNDIKNKIKTAIEKALSDVKKQAKESANNSEIQTISSHDRELKTLLYFIENGSMPWWISKADEVTFFEKINFENLKKDVFTIPFGKLIQQKNIQKRIINQFSNQEIALITSALLDSETSQKLLSANDLLQFLNSKPHEFKTSFWQLIFDVWNDKKTIEIIEFYHQKRIEFISIKMSFDFFIQNLKVFFPLNTGDDELMKMNNNYLISEKEKSIIKPTVLKINKEKIIPDRNKKKQPDAETNKEETISESKLGPNSIKEELTIENFDIQEDNIFSKSFYVQNAGLIILHPFIKEMLKNCNLVDDNSTITNKELAAHILHYAATKKENDYEHAMLFEKFLCGIPIQQSIQREISIEEKHKQQVEEMLFAVIKYWSALKSTSIDVVRTEFLQRQGKLDLSESNPKLNIERKTQDLLLEKIPWNINIIKIAWIEKLIYTQW